MKQITIKEIPQLKLTDIVDLEFDGIDHRDAMDFCNAYLSDGWIKNGTEFRKLTEDELNWLTDNERDWFYEKLMDYIF